MHCCDTDLERLGARCVHNSGRCGNHAASDPDMLVRGILKEILSAMQGEFCATSNFFPAAHHHSHVVVPDSLLTMSNYE